MPEASTSAGRPSLEGGDALLEDVVGRVVDPVVVESRRLQVEHRAGVLGIDEVVGHRLVDGHGHRPGAIGAVAAVDGDGLVVHAPQPLLFVTPAIQLAYSRVAVARHGQSARAPTSSKGNDSTSDGVTLAPDDPLVQRAELLPVAGGHAVKGQAGHIVALAEHVSPCVAVVLTEQAGRIVLGVALDEYDLGARSGLGDHAPTDLLRLECHLVAGRQHLVDGDGVEPRVREDDVGAEAGGQRVGAAPAGGRRRCTWPSSVVRSIPSNTARAAWADRQDNSMERTRPRPHDSRPARSSQ